MTNSDVLVIKANHFKLNCAFEFEFDFKFGSTRSDVLVRQCRQFELVQEVNIHFVTDMKGFLESVSKREYLRHVIYLNEFCCREMQRLSEKFGRPIMQETVIFDMENISWKMMAQKAVMEIGIEITKLTEAHYPEYLRKVFVINGKQSLYCGTLK